MVQVITAKKVRGKSEGESGKEPSQPAVAPRPRFWSERWFGRRVPRVVEKWLASIEFGDWHGKPVPSWLAPAQEIAERLGCTLIWDPEHRWQESAYLGWENSFGRGTILLGGAGGSPTAILSVFAHELGHHVVASRGQVPADRVEHEQAAWSAAHELAAEYGLPVCTVTRRRGLYSYRYAALLAETAGSRKKTRPRKPTKAERLRVSGRSAGVGVEKDVAPPLGDKGKRHAKREIKRATTRAERREKSPGEE